MEQEVKRNADGTFADGSSGNPKGRPRGRMTWQDYADRIDHFLTEFTRAQIKEIVLDDEKFDRFVVRDAFIIQTIAEGLSKDGLMSRKELISRVIGEALKRGEITGANGGPLEFTTDAARRGIEGKLLSETSAGSSGKTAGDSDG